eukprot:TRINITY_DN47955_c0_g1_i1.p2 TRINITY_DN47955_c0_g1~~TRINITY_DN47955_c0_g1_i1.p2  ORF type:complete len:385 (+),score=158.66 TRINITY_DN47955_c0_g1_i1:60-1157(+)
MSSRQVFFEKPPAIDEGAVDELEGLVRRKYDLRTGFAEPHKLAQAMEKTFKGFDLITRGNRITRESFMVAMQKLNCCDDKHAALALFDRYDSQDRGYLIVQEFCAGIFGLKAAPQSSPECRDVLSTVKERILARGGKNGVRSLTRILRLMDDNGNRKLNSVELHEGLLHYGVELNDPELETIFQYFDRDKSGSVSITEFLVGMRGKMSAPRISIVKQAFVRLDKDDDRRVTMDDLLKCYQTGGHPDVLSGEKSQEDVIREFAAGWDKNGDDVITEHEFLDYYKDLSAGIDDDQYFELMIRNAWHIAGGKGLAENTSNRRVLVTHLDGSQTVECLVDDLGIGDDLEKVKAQLRKQGINDILRVRLN